MSEQPRLIALSGPEDGRAYPLGPQDVSLGRDEKHTIAITWDGSVSRRAHARVICRGGLYWLEDLGSTTGTYLMLPGVEESIKLSPQHPTLLLDGAVVRLGKSACFQVAGISASMNEAARLLLQRLDALRAGLQHLPAELQALQRERLHEMECKLRDVKDEEELLALAAAGIATIDSEESPANVDPPKETPVVDVLPPLPKNLPEPGDPNRLDSLQNVFLARLAPLTAPGDDEDESHEQSC